MIKMGWASSQKKEYRSILILHITTLLAGYPTGKSSLGSRMQSNKNNITISLKEISANMKN